ncbi:Pantoate-beta-alanine ligase [Symmachiella dynata]|nr:Pantoate-beta-alanine ligase [Symmachiella dynata]
MAATDLQTMNIAKSIVDVRAAVAAARGAGKKIGLVPTMGALHEGHLSLMRAAREECDYLVVSIFVNPTQFSPHEDLDRYPRPIEEDLRGCGDEGVDLVFHPDVATIYPAGDQTIVEAVELSTIVEGAHRPGHFRGVTTVVLKLLNIVAPDVAYFGRKDYQQQLIIRQMCRDLALPVEIATCPTIREADGLALSSRNRYLSESERETALSLSQCLQFACDRVAAGETDLTALRQEMVQRMQQTPGVELDYATILDAETLSEDAQPTARLVALIAARVGTTRLIDNMVIEPTDSL